MSYRSPTYICCVPAGKKIDQPFMGFCSTTYMTLWGKLLGTHLTPKIGAQIQCASSFLWFPNAISECNPQKSAEECLQDGILKNIQMDLTCNGFSSFFPLKMGDTLEYDDNPPAFLCRNGSGTMVGWWLRPRDSARAAQQPRKLQDLHHLKCQTNRSLVGKLQPWGFPQGHGRTPQLSSILDWDFPWNQPAIKGYPHLWKAPFEDVMMCTMTYHDYMESSTWIPVLVMKDDENWWNMPYGFSPAPLPSARHDW